MFCAADVATSFALSLLSFDAFGHAGCLASFSHIGIVDVDSRWKLTVPKVAGQNTWRPSSCRKTDLGTMARTIHVHARKVKWRPRLQIEGTWDCCCVGKHKSTADLKLPGASCLLDLKVANECYIYSCRSFFECANDTENGMRMKSATTA